MKILDVWFSVRSSRSWCISATNPPPRFSIGQGAFSRPTRQTSNQFLRFFLHDGRKMKPLLDAVDDVANVSPCPDEERRAVEVAALGGEIQRRAALGVVHV